MPATYLDFDRASWAKLRAATPLTLSEADLAELQGLNEQVSLAGGRDDLPAALAPAQPARRRHADAAPGDRHVSRQRAVPTPYVIGIAGSVAVGKSTFARILRALLARWPDHPRVDLVTTDGFLLPNATLEVRGLMERKGFPESYDVRRLVQFMSDVKAARAAGRGAGLLAPALRHRRRPRASSSIGPTSCWSRGSTCCRPATGSPDVRRGSSSPTSSISRSTSTPTSATSRLVRRPVPGAARDRVPRPAVVLPPLRRLSPVEAVETARGIWRTDQRRQPGENIQPTRERAHLVLEKADDHAVRRVRLRPI